jgi:NADH-quinone oxidoreductase subunit N
VMALNVVVALYYYLQWTAALFRAAETEPVPAAGAAVARPRAVPLTVAIALTAAAGIALSGAPQLVLRFASSTLL